ncbi:MAG: substrate-binding domain-containing protein [Betaproteobacteria bacterium]|nr:substrate-binding domain-containing protein [Betaproteobacteria bacterium]
MKHRAAVVWLGMIFAGVASCASAQALVRMGGSGAGAGIVRQLGDAFTTLHPTIRVVYAPNLGSGGGYRALSTGRLDISVGSRLPKSGEGKGLKVERFARSPFVIVVQQRNAASAITIPVLEHYYRDPGATWPDGTRVRLVLRPADDSDTALLRAFSPGVSAALDQGLQRPGMLLGPSDTDAADLVERTPGALGTTTLGLILAERRALKALELDGKRPSPEAIAKGQYPHVKTLYLATSAATGAAARQFIAFMRSARGAALLREYGFLPATN